MSSGYLEEGPTKRLISTLRTLISGLEEVAKAVTSLNVA